MAEEGSSPLGETALDEVEPRAMFGGVNIFEASRTGGQVSHRFLGDRGEWLSSTTRMTALLG